MLVSGDAGVRLEYLLLLLECHTLLLLYVLLS
jgi:hypothetical protein